MADDKESCDSEEEYNSLKPKAIPREVIASKLVVIKRKSNAHTKCVHRISSIDMKKCVKNMKKSNNRTGVQRIRSCDMTNHIQNVPFPKDLKSTLTNANNTPTASTDDKACLRPSNQRNVRSCDEKDIAANDFDRASVSSEKEYDSLKPKAIPQEVVASKSVVIKRESNLMNTNRMWTEEILKPIALPTGNHAGIQEVSSANGHGKEAQETIDARVIDTVPKMCNNRNDLFVNESHNTTLPPIPSRETVREYGSIITQDVPQNDSVRSRTTRNHYGQDIYYIDNNSNAPLAQDTESIDNNNFIICCLRFCCCLKE